MKSNKRFITIILLLAVIVFLCWKFIDIVIYMLIALALAFIGQPLMRLLQKIKIKRWEFPTALAAAITLVVLFGTIALFCIFIGPVLINEFNFVASIDPTAISTGLTEWLNNADPFLHKFGFLSQTEHFADMVTDEMLKMSEAIDMSNIVSNTASAIKAIFIGTFSVLFMTFFTLKDHRIFFKMIGRWIPVQYRNNFANILNATGKQLSSYFIGVFIDMMCVGIIIFILCLALRIPNAILIGAIGGLMNIIPFVGPIIACILGLVISLTSLIPSNPDSAMIIAMLIKIVSVFCVTKLLDDFILQPTIYGKRTQTHPLEIFIVILMAGSVGGILAMIFAVPLYTLLRTVVKEFFGAYFFNDNELERGTAEESGSAQ